MKKKLLGLLLMVFCTSIVSAQEEKGVFVEGSVSLASDRLGKYFASDFFIVTPGIGYQFNEKLSVGFKVGLSNDDVFEWKSYTSFVRYKFYTLGKAGLFTEGKVSQYVFPNPGLGGSSHHFVEAGFSLGISVPFNEHFKLVCQYLHIGYSNEYNRDEAKHGMNLHCGDWVLDANIKRLSIGLNWLF